MELVIPKIADIDTSISFVPLKSAWPINEIFIKVANEGTILCMERPTALLSAIRELATVTNLLVSSIVISKTMHTPIKKFSCVCLSSS